MKATTIFALCLSFAAVGYSQTVTRPPATFADYTVDSSLDACVDFHTYACATWEKAHPIPADRSSFGTGTLVYEWNQAVLRDIVDGAGKGDHAPGSADQKIGDYYEACLDEAAVEKQGLSALQPELDRIAALKSRRDLPALLAHEHRITSNLLAGTDSGATTAVFGVGSTPDFDNAQLVVAAIDQGGLGLPDREYYFRDDAKSKALRDGYVALIRKTLKLAGESETKAAADAKVVLAIETELARGSMEIVKRRDPANLNHKMSLAELGKLTPSFDWSAYFAGLRMPKPDHYLVFSLDYLRGFNALLVKRPLSDWKTYLRWNLLNLSDENLPLAFRQANFDFYGKALSGRKEMRPRWKVCSDATDRDLGELIGRVYVTRAFPPASKEKMLRLVHALEQAFGEEITSLDWMSEATKQQAHVKLAAILDKIGYPDKWRDYSALTVDRNHAIRNAYQAGLVAVDYDLAKVGKPRDRTQWGMTPPTVNAYYSGSDNTINFPAGILQPPFFDPDADDALNFGAVGAVIGHELTHGFDDQGRKFDGEGNLRDWWTAEDAKKFEERTRCIKDEYGSFVAVDDVKLNGELTLGENTADNGGLRIALRALHDVLKAEGKESESINGLTADQRFFLAFAHVWCGARSPEALRMMAQTNPHSPSAFRINGTVSNMPEFRAAFGCKPGQPMVRDPACATW
ncbi:MAG TPA: M13 family metallopeptidase [Thermoanaerobaculia bacterium]|nr:M13 family metallopeptidase [Thermoanaerobaculia bacterium]